MTKLVSIIFDAIMYTTIIVTIFNLFWLLCR